MLINYFIWSITSLTHTPIVQLQNQCGFRYDKLNGCVILKTRKVSNIISTEALALNDSGSTTNILRILCQDSFV